MRLPEFLYRMEPVGPLLRAIEAGEAVLREACEGRNDQLSVRTATDGLRLWEADYGLRVSEEEDEEDRRARIYAALMGGQTLTRSALKQLAMTLNGADASAVDEDFAGHRVMLTLLYENRVPLPVSPALREAVERFRPGNVTVDIVSAMRLQGELRRYHALTGKVMLTVTGQRTNGGGT